MSDNYVSRVLNGDAIWTDIDDYVEEWHEGDSPEPIPEYLGMTRKEYGLFAEQPRSLRFILAAHETDQTVEDLLANADDEAVAARGLSTEDASAIREWLRETGRLPSS